MLFDRGATLVNKPQDILDALDFKNTGMTMSFLFDEFEMPQLTKEEEAIFNIMRRSMSTSSDIIEKTGLLPSEVSMIISQLEIKEVIQNANGTYSISSGQYHKHKIFDKYSLLLYSTFRQLNNNTKT